MKEVEPDEKWIDESTESNDSGSGEVAGRPSETELVIVALLMRLYDINLALLAHYDPARADEIFEAHEKGGTFNPPIFIPTVGE